MLGVELVVREYNGVARLEIDCLSGIVRVLPIVRFEVAGRGRVFSVVPNRLMREDTVVRSSMELRISR